MEIFVNDAETLQALCKFRNKWGMLISFSPTEEEVEVGIVDDAPYLNIRHPLMDNIDTTCNLISYGGGIILFDTEVEMRLYYGMTHGDDDGGNVYALTCSPDGDLLAENT